MSKKMRSLVCVMLSVVMLFSMNVWVGATVAAEGEAQPQPRFSYTAFTATGLSISTKGAATCLSSVEGYDGITTKIHIKMTLQKRGVLLWNEVKTWESTFNDMEAIFTKNTTVGSGDYRVKAVYTVYSGSASEKITSYSQIEEVTVS